MGGLGVWMLLFLLSLLYGRGCGVHITGITVPRIVLSGGMVKLSCSFQLDGADLYSLTWWKDDKMFYNYVPKNSQPKSVYAAPGITVNISSLNEVILSHVDHRASGKLRCEVLADKPSFEQDTKDANMTVIAEPSHGPRITGARGPYRVGHLLLLNCSSPFSYPPTTLTWHINGHQASQETVVVYPGETDGQGREASWSGLHMWLQGQHFQRGILVLRCTATILNVYKKSSEVIIADSSYIESSPREDASTAGAGSWSCVVLLLLLLLLLGLMNT
ncbi:uncharacterized protein [Panulirus ornatus]|uniref:uncharacterized protein isoform X2 n=1 Tax=Panulirus ornatus TaxID=150431 RepID=UPI003A88AE73